MNKRKLISHLKSQCRTIQREIAHIDQVLQAEDLTIEDKKFLEWRENLYIGRHMGLEEIIEDIKLGIIK